MSVARCAPYPRILRVASSGCESSSQRWGASDSGLASALASGPAAARRGKLCTGHAAHGLSGADVGCSPACRPRDHPSTTPVLDTHHCPRWYGSQIGRDIVGTADPGPPPTSLLRRKESARELKWSTVMATSPDSAGSNRAALRNTDLRHRPGGVRDRPLMRAVLNVVTAQPRTAPSLGARKV